MQKIAMIKTIHAKNEKEARRKFFEKYPQMEFIKFLCLFLALFLCFNFVSASTNYIQTLGTFKSGTTINLIQNCINSTYSNITRITLPNSAFAINVPTAMVKIGDDYSYSYAVSDLGQYLVYGKCDENANPVSWVYDFYITTTGKSGIATNNILPITLLVLGFLIFGIALWQKNEIIGLFSGFIFIATGIYMMIYGFGQLADNYTRIIAFISLGIGLVLCFVSMLEMFYGWGGEENSSEE